MNGQIISSVAPFKSKLVQKIIEAQKELTIMPAVESISENVRQVTRCANTQEKGSCSSCAMTLCPALALASKIANH